MADMSSDPRIDPRIKAALGHLQTTDGRDVSSREEAIELESSPQRIAREAVMGILKESCDSDAVAPSSGLEISVREFSSQPDGNAITVRFIRARDKGPLPCVYYIHGGGMATSSAFDPHYRAWGRIIARYGVAVAMVDFRNCLTPSSAPEVVPYPGGLNDCVSGIRWLAANADELGVDPARIVIAGESGGGNLTLATGMKLLRDGDIGIVRGLYALCPYIAGSWPRAELPSSTENNGLLLDLHHNRAAMAYGWDAFAAADPLAWPLFASPKDVAGLPATTISVNECDPLRDEGIAFYRLLLSSGVAARCRQVMGTIHATEIFAALCPEISRDTARDLAAMCRGD